MSDDFLQETTALVGALHIASTAAKSLQHRLKAAVPAAAAPVATNQFAWARGEENRISLRPILHEDIWSFRKTIEALHWTADEVDLTKDKADWEKRLDEKQRHFIKRQLGFFAQIDQTVLRNIDDNFSKEINCLEAAFVLRGQADQECIHTDAYNLQIEAVMEGKEREETMNAVRHLPSIAAMQEWVNAWFDRALPIGDRLVAFAAVEGVLFSASFSAIQWLREINALPGITAFNSFIVRDEGVHTLFTCLLIRKYLRARPSQARVEEIFKSVVDVLDDFVADSLPEPLPGMTAELMRQYVRFQADCVLLDMDYNPVWHVDNPFKFMDKLTLNAVSKQNFFEKIPTEYQNVSNSSQSLFVVDDTNVDDY